MRLPQLGILLRIWFGFRLILIGRRRFVLLVGGELYRLEALRYLGHRVDWGGRRGAGAASPAGGIGSSLALDMTATRTST